VLRLIPLASVLSPGSLTTELVDVDYSLTHGNCNVSTLNFSVAATSDWRHPTKRPGYLIAFWNTTPPPPATADVVWYDQPAFQTTKLTTLAIFGGHVVAERDSPCPSYNCSYTMEFYAPWYNCSKVTFDDLPADQFAIDSFVPRSPSLLDGGENLIYKAQIFDNLTEYKRPYPRYDSKEYADQGTFRGDPDIYLGFVVNTTIPIENVTAETRWNFTMDSQAWRCEHQRAKYTVLSQWTDKQLTSRTANVSEGVPLLPRGEVLGPKTGTTERYREFVAYYIVGSIWREQIKGSMTLDNGTLGILAKNEPKLHTTRR